MGKRDDKSKSGKAAPAARPKTSSSAKARQPVAASRATVSKAPAKAPAKAAPKPAAKAVTPKPAAKAAAAAPAKAKPVTKAAQKQSDKKLVDRAKASAIVLPADYRPSEDEPFMNEFQRLYFRQKLLNWKEEIIRQTKETLEGLHEDSVQHADLADRATSETDRALELRARDRQRKLISKIDAALARIEDGTYGYCEETGEPIGLKRLDARPIATLSLEAQERHERRERVYRED
jgi:DnaK suppressor protein